ncbi:MAG: dTDP-glucose 4,6-dehydratase [bacterium]
MRLLITGGAGFIGSNFVKYILKKYSDYQVTVLDALTYAGNLDNFEQDIFQNPKFAFHQGNICDKEIVDSLMKDTDAVVHFAAETHVDRSILEAGTFIQTNVYGTYILLESAKKHNIKRFLHISTDEVYGEAKSPNGEGRPSLETDPLMPKSPYAASKAGADRLAYSYYTNYKLPVVISRCSNNYGPYQYPEKLIPLFISNALENKPLPVYGSGINTRDWIYVLDHCEALDLLLHTAGQDGEVFNIGGGEEFNILQIGKTILQIVGKNESLMQFVTDRPGHVMRHAVNTSKIKKIFGWHPTVSFREGIKQTIDWYINNESWWRNIKEKSKEYQEFTKKWYVERS